MSMTVQERPNFEEAQNPLITAGQAIALQPGGAIPAEAVSGDQEKADELRELETAVNESPAIQAAIADIKASLPPKTTPRQPAPTSARTPEVAPSTSKPEAKRPRGWKRFAAWLAVVGAMTGGVYSGAAEADSKIHGQNVSSANGYSFDTVTPPHNAHQDSNKGQPITVAVEGDSLSAETTKSIYNTQAGSEWEVWYNRMNTQFGFDFKFHVFAQGKSGYLKEGEIDPHSTPEVDGSGTNFMQRLEIPQIAHAIEHDDLMIVAGGFNDALFKMNKPDGELEPSTLADVEQAITTYMDKLLEMRTAAGHDPRTVLVTDIYPGGTRTHSRNEVVPIIKAQALAHGFTFVEEKGSYQGNKQQSRDGVHYKGEAGSKVAQQFIREAQLHHVVATLMREQQEKSEE
jgi:hypothetical protein